MSAITKLESADALEDAFAASHDHPVLLFKHSLTCSISRRAFDAYQSFVAGREDGDTRFALIEVQRQRQLSREVEARTGVKHESPQALVLRDGEVRWHDSHWRITGESLAAGLDSAQAALPAAAVTNL